MTVYSLVLFLHLLAVVAAFAFAAVIHIGVEHLRGAQTVGEALSGLKMAARGERKMPWVGFILLLTGGYMTQAVWSWKTPWVLVSLAGLVVLEGLGGATGGRRRRQLASLLPLGRTQALTPELWAGLQDGFTRATEYLLPLLAVGIMLVMVTKPNAALGTVELVVSALIGAAIGLRPVAARIGPPVENEAANLD